MSTTGSDEQEPWRIQWAVSESSLGERYKWLLKAMGYYSEDAKNERAASLLYVSARKQAARKEFSQYLGVKEDFSTRFYLECLHVWMVLVRLRREGNASKQIRQDVFDRFWQDITKQIHALGVKPIALSARVRELQNAFYGAAIAYDYSLGTNDAVLASALYRNVYGHDCKARHLLMLTAYVRRELDVIDKMEIQEFLDANWSFGNPHDGLGPSS